jgi:hypothetical protein
LIARSDVVSESSTEYNAADEYEYRNAEYEYEHEEDKEPEPKNAPKDAASLSPDQCPPRVLGNFKRSLTEL